MIDGSVAQISDVADIYSRLAADPVMRDISLLVPGDPADHERVMLSQRIQDAFITRPVRPKMLLIIIRDLIYNKKPEWFRLLKFGNRADSVPL